MRSGGVAKQLNHFIIFGPPGCGKGTISSRIRKKYPSIEYLSAGDLLRKNVREGSDIGREVAPILAAGKLVPNELIINVMTKELKALDNSSWLIDGYPRTLEQAEAILSGHPITSAIYLNVAFEIIIDRLSSRYIHEPSGRVYNKDFNPPKRPGFDDVTGEKLILRDDDKPATVRRRLETYEEMTKPLINLFVKHKILAEFRGATSDEIWPHVDAHLAEYFTHREN